MTSTTFARITIHHEQVLSALSPCAQALYRFALRSAPAGKACDLDIEDFREAVRHRWQGFRSYSDRQIRRAIAELVAGVGDWRPIEVLRRYGARYLRIVAHHPSEVGDDWPKMSKSRSKMSKILPSNQHSVVEDHIYPHTAVDEKLSSKEDDCPPRGGSPPGPELGPEDRDLLDQVAIATGGVLSAAVRTAILAAGAERVGAALGALSEAKAGRGLRNPLGFFLAALRDGWRAASLGAERPRYPEGFLCWYEQAIAAGVVLPLRPELLGCDRYGDPLVRVPSQGRPYDLICWRSLADSN